MLDDAEHFLVGKVWSLHQTFDIAIEAMAYASIFDFDSS